MARYLERAEDTARLVNVYAALQLETPVHLRSGWGPIVTALGLSTAEPKVDERAAIQLLLTDTNSPASILSSLRQARECARTMREIIPREAWESINVLYRETRDGTAQLRAKRHRPDRLAGIVRSVEQIGGLLDATMLHDQGFTFLELGRNLERADMTTRIIDAATSATLQEGSVADLDTVRWVGVLKSVSGFQMYLRSMNRAVQPELALRFILKDTRFPRAVRFCLDEVHVRLRTLKGSVEIAAQVEELAERVARRRIGKRPDDGLARFLDRLQLHINRIGAAITDTYFR